MFYLHEDEWGMIAVMPAENMARAGEVAQEAAEFGEAHRAEGGVGWTDMYVIPEEEHPIAEKGIRLEELRGLIEGRLAEADKVESGYSSYREAVERAFAFGEADGDVGAFYGNVGEGVILGLYLLRPDEENEEAVGVVEEMLRALGERYGLMLADWWQDVAVDLTDREAVGRYLRG